MVLLRRGRIICHLQKIMVSAKKKRLPVGYGKKIGDHLLDLNRLSSLQRYFFSKKWRHCSAIFFQKKKGLRRDDWLKTAIIGKIKTVEKVQHCFDVNFIQHRDEEFPLWCCIQMYWEAIFWNLEKWWGLKCTFTAKHFVLWEQVVLEKRSIEIWVRFFCSTREG